MTPLSIIDAASEPASGLVNPKQGISRPSAKARQPLLLLLLGAKAHQQFAGAERVRHHHGDGGGHRT